MSQHALPVPGSHLQPHGSCTMVLPGKMHHGTAVDPGRVTVVLAHKEATILLSQDTQEGPTHTPNVSQVGSADDITKITPCPTEKTITRDTIVTNLPAPTPGDRKRATTNRNQSSGDYSCDI